MKGIVSLITVVVAVGVLGFALNVAFVPAKILPPNAPFKIEVSGNNFNVEEVTAVFNGISESAKKLPSVFEFNAPKILNEMRESFPLVIKVLQKNGKVEKYNYVLSVDRNASGVAVVKPLMHTAPNGAFSQNASFEISYYKGRRIEELDWYMNNSLEKKWSFSTVSPMATKLRVTIPSKMLKNGWVVFTLAEKLSNGEKHVLWSNVYIFDRVSPLLKWNEFSYCPSSTEVTFNVTTFSTLCSIKWVKVNGQKAKRVGKNSYTVRLISPKTMGEWPVRIESLDEAGNLSIATSTIFVSGKKPVLIWRDDADYIQRGKILTLWKKKPPLHVEISASSVGILFHKMVLRVNGEKVRTCSKILTFSKTGDYVLNVSAEDEINRTHVSTTLKFKVNFDDIPPTLKGISFHATALKNANGYTVIGPVSTLEVTVKATDNKGGVGVKKILITPLSSGKSNVRTFYLPNLKTGKNSYPIKIILEDEMGNSTVITKDIKIFVDDQAPSLSLSPVYANLSHGVYWDSSAFKVRFTSNTKGKVSPLMKIYVNGKLVKSIVSSDYTLNLKKSGRYTVKVVSVNRVNGMRNEKIERYALRLDRKAPTIEFASVPATAGPDRNVKVTIKAFDALSGIQNVLVNGHAAKFENGVYILKMKTPSFQKSGIWFVNVEAKDKVGNVRKEKKRIFIDASAPRIDVEVSPKTYFKNGIYWSGKAPFTVTIKGMTDSGIAPNIKSWFGDHIITNNVFYVKEDKDAILKVTAVDPFNDKKTTFLKEYVFKFDRTPPVFSHITFDATVAPTSEMLVKLRAEDPGYGEVKSVKINNVVAEREGTTWLATLTVPNYRKNGKFPITMKAYDIFGNESVKSDYALVDANKPEIELYMKAANVKKPITKREVYFFKETPGLYCEVVAAGKTMFNMDVNGKKVDNGTKVKGINLVKVMATDMVNGQKSTLTRRFYVVVDDKKPSVKLKIPKFLNSQSKISFAVRDEYLRYGLFTVKAEGKTLYTKLLTSNGTEELAIAPVVGETSGEKLTFMLTAVDMAGNTVLESATATVNTVLPQVEDVQWNGKKLIVLVSEKLENHGIPEVLLLGSGELKGYGQIGENGKEIIFTFKNGEPKLNENYKVEIKNVEDSYGNPVKETVVKIHE